MLERLPSAPRITIVASMSRGTGENAAWSSDVVDAEPSSSESEFFSTVGVSRCDEPARTLLRRWLAQLATEVIEELRAQRQS